MSAFVHTYTFSVYPKLWSKYEAALDWTKTLQLV